MVSAFSAMSALAGFGAGFVGRRVPLGLRLALAAALMGGFPFGCLPLPRR